MGVVGLPECMQEAIELKMLNHTICGLYGIDSNQVQQLDP